MATITSVAIDKHTTSSTPDPHILYAVDVTLDDGSRYEVLRRYSQFVELHASLGDPYQLPPKKSLAHVVVPSAWVDDELIASRKAGLLAYINALLRSARYRESHVLLSFLSDDDEHITPAMICNLEANLASQPATSLSTYVAGAYYPDWAASTHPPASLDFSKFDILFFAFVTPNSSASISWHTGSEATLQTLVSAARNSGHATKIVLSIGGWGGSYWFSHSMSSASNRGKLVGALVDAVNIFGLDGIDIDWEYPNSPGSGNPYS
ncbi:glycoside hydrolase, partial [Hymenopellis radicata]